MIFLRESWDWDRARPGLDRADAMMGNSEKTSLLNPSSGSKDILSHPFFFIIEPLILPPQIACPTPTHSAQEFLKSFYVAFVKKNPQDMLDSRTISERIRVRLPASLRLFPFGYCRI